MNCLYDRAHSYSYMVFFVIMAVFIPTIVIISCYTKIYIVVLKSKNKVADVNQTSRTTSDNSRSVRLARTLFCIFVVFLICWMPNTLFVLIDYKDELPVRAYAFSITIAHINSSINFILYGVTHREFRKGYVAILTSCYLGSKIYNLFARWCCIKTDEGISVKTLFTRIEVSSIRLNNREESPVGLTPVETIKN